MGRIISLKLKLTCPEDDGLASSTTIDIGLQVQMGDPPLWWDENGTSTMDAEKMQRLHGVLPSYFG